MSVNTEPNCYCRTLIAMFELLNIRITTESGSIFVGGQKKSGKGYSNECIYP